MKNIIIIFALLFLSANLFADDHNTPVPAEGTMTATVIKPLLSTFRHITNGQGPMSFDVIRDQVRPITADNEWRFEIEGEPGKNVIVNMFPPVPFPENDGHPVLTGNWYGPEAENLGSANPVEEEFHVPPDSFFDVFYKLDGINALGATLGNKTYKLEVRFWYADL
jgi:hypothetical protein